MDPKLGAFTCASFASRLYTGSSPAAPAPAPAHAPVAAVTEEAEETDLAGLPRLVLTPKKTDFGMLRLLIDTINNSETEA